MSGLGMKCFALIALDIGGASDASSAAAVTVQCCTKLPCTLQHGAVLLLNTHVPCESPTTS